MFHLYMIVMNLRHWGKMTSLDRLVMLFLVQPRMLHVGFWGQSPSLAHLQLAHQKPRVLFWNAVFQPVLGCGAVPPHGLHLAFFFVGCHCVSIGPFLQPMQVPLKSSTSIQCIGHCSRFGTICKLTECVLWPFVQVINGDVNPYWPQNHLQCMFSCFPDELHTTDAPFESSRSVSLFPTHCVIFSAWRDTRLFQCAFPFTHSCSLLLPTSWFPGSGFPEAPLLLSWAFCCLPAMSLICASCGKKESVLLKAK